MISKRRLKAAAKAMRDAMTESHGDPWEHAARAVLEADEREAWRPIEEAPKEHHKPLDLWVVHSQHGGHREANAYWSGVGTWADQGGNFLDWSFEESDGSITICRVTHFRPLPSPPAIHGKTEG
jgi:hypothetical protein